ncbi:MAG TPA: hypothetical protein VNI52_01265 [Sphingobacteriaceae bacterium]|nr:hypothetical protein [Sphingobacteriaceae bacterium]
MKAVFKIFFPVIFLSACADGSKELPNVSQGMNKQQVIQLIGEPPKRKNLAVAELWTYPDYNKTLIFRSDTVYDIISASTLKVDSIESSFKNLGNKLKRGTKKVGKELDTLGKKLEGKLDRDTSKKK